MSPAVDIRDEDGIAVARLPPEIDLSNVGEVRAHLISGLQPSTVGLILDLSSTIYLDSKGIQLLMELEQHLRKTRQPFRLAVPSDDSLTRLLDIAGVPIRRHETVALALQDIAATT